MPETAVFDHYEVFTRDDGSLFELGRGAMGITYKAFDTRLRVPVALKVINGTYLNSDVARRRFVREAQSAAKIQHRHVATVFHLGTEGETWFYAMEFIDGETVESLIKSQGPLTPLLALNITGQVAKALNAAAQQGLVHRDIKPANLMLVHQDDELVAKVIDFGLAKTSVTGDAEDAATLSMGGFVGTPHFASPEQLEEKEIDSRSDIYSLGVTLWYMLAGQAPFGGSMAQVMSQHLSKPPPFERLENLPPAAAELLKKMLEKDPADRFQSPNELRKAVEDALQHIGDAPAVAVAAAEVEDEKFETLLATSAVRAGETRFEVGVVLAGRYRIEEVLGETNAGRAFRALDGERQRTVRLLVLHPEFLGDAAAITGLEREVEALRTVEHPHLLGVYDFETIEQASFLALEWTDGFSLLEVLRARRELEAGETLVLLQQAAAGVDHALRLGLGGLEFGLHQMLVHFAAPVTKSAVLRAPVADWPAYVLKLYPLGLKRDLASSQTWAGGQTMVEGAAVKGERLEARPRYIQALAAVAYELLGGTLSPVALSGVAAPRYAPLATLSEEGNEVLRRALDPARSFASAQEFCTALIELDGLQVRRHDSSAPPAPVAPPPLPTRKKAAPVAALAAFAAAVLILGGGGYFLLKDQPPKLAGPTAGDLPTPGESPGPGVTPPGDDPPPTPPTTPPPPVPTTPVPVPATPPPPSRQEMLMAAMSRAEALEEKGNWAPSLDAWLRIAKEFPESPVGKNHLETMLNRLRDRPSPISPEEFARMREQITDAADFNILSAMLLLGDNLRTSEPRTAFKWFSAAAERGDATALTQLGFMVAKGGEIGKPDFIKAAEHFQAAADKGDIGGKFALGQCFVEGLGVEKDEKRGAELLRAAVAGGDARAMDILGNCYMRGTGVEKDHAEAFRLFSKAAEVGNLKAMGNLGTLYMTGRGGPEANPKKAAELFEKGAKAGDGSCMFNFAQCLNEGLGTAKNQLLAQSWYRKAAEAGDRRAIDWCRQNGVPYTK